MSAKNTRASSATTTTATTRSRARKAVAAAIASVAGTAAAAMVASAVAPAAAMATTLPTTNCSATPSKCGFPDATNSGVRAGVTLKSVPAQVSSGPGWTSSPDGSVEVSGNGAVLSGLSITGNLDISASNVIISNVKVVTGGTFGVTLRHTTGVTIENSTISGKDATSGRVSYAVDDIYGDSTGMTVKNNNIAYYRTAVAVSTGLVTGNYIHDPGYVAGDHTNGIFDAGTTQPLTISTLTISNNTIFNSLGQTDAISLNASCAGCPVANKTVTGNLLAGGGYVIYGGSSLGNTSTNMVIKNNDFGQAYFARSGYYGPAAYFNSAGTGNLWTGNRWDTTGLTVPAP